MDSVRVPMTSAAKARSPSQHREVKAVEAFKTATTSKTNAPISKLTGMHNRVLEQNYTEGEVKACWRLKCHNRVVLLLRSALAPEALHKQHEQSSVNSVQTALIASVCV